MRGQSGRALGCLLRRARWWRCYAATPRWLLPGLGCVLLCCLQVANEVKGALGSVKNFLESIKLSHKHRRMLAEGEADVEEWPKMQALHALPPPETIVDHELHAMHDHVERSIMSAHVEGMRKFREMQPEAFDVKKLILIKNMKLKFDQVHPALVGKLGEGGPLPGADRGRVLNRGRRFRSERARHQHRHPGIENSGSPRSAVGSEMHDSPWPPTRRPSIFCNPCTGRMNTDLWLCAIRGGAFLRRTTAWGVLHNPPPFFRWPKF